MSKSREKKVARKLLIGFTHAALKELLRRTQKGRLTQTQVLHEALLGGTDKFNPHVEGGIKAYEKLNGCSRHEAIEGLLSDAMLAHASSRDSG